MSLWLDDNPLWKLFAETGQLRQLKSLIANNCQLTAILTTIEQLIQLKELCLNNNHLTDLPAEIQQRQQLEKLASTRSNIAMEAQEKIKGWLPNCDELYF